MVMQPNEYIAVFQKSAREAIGVRLTEWAGEQRVDIRIYVQAIGEEHLVPTKKGVSIPIEKFPELLDGFQKLGDVMSTDKVVARIPHTTNTEIRIGVNSFRNETLIFVRQFRKDEKKSEEWLPTSKGVSMKVALYPDILKAVEGIAEHLKEEDDTE